MKISIKLVNIELPIQFGFDLKLLATFKNLRFYNFYKQLSLRRHQKSRQISIDRLSDINQNQNCENSVAAMQITKQTPILLFEKEFFIKTCNNARNTSI